MEEFAYLETGEKFSFKGYEYLMKPYSDLHPYQVHKKCTQVGITTQALFSALHGCINLYPKGVAYFFPTDGDVTDFSKSRCTPIIENNPEIQKYVSDTDAVGIKKINKSFLYLRGMKSKSKLKSIPVDEIIIDELDETDPSAKEMAEKRLSASVFQHKKYLSNPSLPDFGIDKEFQKSDQMHYLLKCPHCGQWNNLNDTFPKCIYEREKDDVILCCFKCSGELDKSQGEWVAKYPKNKDIRGYQYTQLFAKNVSPKSILTEYRIAQKEGRLTNFYNLTLGQAYVSAKDRLTKEQVLALSSNDFPADFWSVKAPCFMGVDVGNDLHIVFKKEVGDKILTLPTIEFDFKALDKYMDKVDICVIDALPETRSSRAFAERNLGKVYLNYYNEHQKGSFKWNEQEFIVQENRTEALDASHEKIKNGAVVLPPYNEMVEEYAQHCNNTAKKLQKDDETGSRRYVWIELGPDHFRHADNYANIAMSGLANMPRGSYF